MRFKELVEFKNKFNHCNVPTRYSEKPALGRWVDFQRKLFRSGSLDRQRLKRLKAIEFEFDPRKHYWKQMYASLAKFKEIYGHCNVPDNFTEIPKLTNWIKYQRVAFEKGTLSNEKVEKLEKLDFLWRPHDKSWEKLYRRLNIFKNRLGHCNVPYKWEKDPQLSQWVYRQRSYQKRGLLEKERSRLLKKIGFL